jgi:hypothetical protein
MTSTPNAKTATAARVAGFLALFAAGAALLVLFAAAAHAALGTSAHNAEHAVGIHRPGAAPHLRQQHSGLHKDGGRHGRPDHRSRVHQAAADGRSGQLRPAHSSPRTELATLRWNHKCAGTARVQGARHGHVRSNPDRVWML